MGRLRHLVRFPACVVLTAFASATACSDSPRDPAPRAVAQPELTQAAVHGGDARGAPPLHESPHCSPGLPNQPLLNTKADNYEGEGGLAVTTADFNGDGVLNLFFTTSSLDFSTRLGLGDGAFGAAVAYSWGEDEGALATADVNGDGHIDVLATDSSAAGVSVFLGKGDGTFTLPTPTGSATPPSSLATGDFNGDGKVDVALGVTGGVNVLLGKGDGTFATGVFHATLSGSQSYVVAGDLNGDGHTDLVVASSSSGAAGVEVLRGVGDGTFVAAATVAGTVFPGTVVIGDFNEDGHPDLVVTTYDELSPPKAPGLQVFAGHGDGTFAAPTAPSGLPALTGQILGGDFNGDGHLDVVDVSGRVILGGGDGTLTPAAIPSHRALEVVSYGFTVGDFNGDGHLDLAGSAGSVLLGKGDGTFPGSTNYAAKGGALAVAFADLDGDGSLDMVAADFEAADVSVFLGNGKGGLTLVSSYNVGSAPAAVALVDVDEDGLLDIVATNQGGIHVAVLGGNGDGTFRKATKWAAGSQPSQLVTGDFNEDGHVDIAVSSEFYLHILLGTGTGAFAAPVAYPIYGSPKAFYIAAADFDGDGHLDVATGADRLEIFHGVGDGTFTATPTITLASTIQALMTGDLNGDGFADLVAYAGGTSVLLGKGDGSFQTPVVYTGGVYGSVRAALGDIDGDGAPDLMMVGEYDVGFLLGNGDGTLRNPIIYATGVKPFGGGLGDLNGDGRLDVVTANFQSSTANELTVRLNTGCL